MDIDEQIAGARQRLADARIEAELIRAAVRSQREALHAKLIEIEDIRVEVRATREELARTRAKGAGGRKSGG